VINKKYRDLGIYWLIEGLGESESIG